MPVSMTKNEKSRSQLEQMMQLACPQIPVREIRELTEGYFNIAYEVTLQNGKQVILKIAPPPQVSVMTCEKNIMAAEVETMRLVSKKTRCPVAEVLYFDQSRSICDSDYFVMEKLPGKSLSSVMDMLTQTEKEQIQFAVGAYNREINQIYGEQFGYFGQPEKQKRDWFSAFKSMLQDTVSDATQLSIPLSVESQKLFSLLEQHKAYFMEVTQPRLVHWDLWAGNIFVKDGNVTGIIDFERSMWADVFMETGFRTSQQNLAFLKGYGLQELSKTQRIRALWYDAYLYLTNSLECDYRQYETREMYHWANEMLLKTYQQLKNC